MIVILLGPPGSGKGTQAKKMSASRGLPQLSTGDMFRSAIAQGTQLGKEAKAFMESGALVPDELVVGLIEERIKNVDCKNGFVLDGFPRNVAQAAVLDRMLDRVNRKVDRVVLFDILDDELVLRLSGRRTCEKCGTMYHILHAKTSVEGVCDNCSAKLIQRSDDKPEVIQARLKVYHQQTEPLVEFYRSQKKLKSLDARQSAMDVTTALVEALSEK